MRKLRNDLKRLFVGWGKYYAIPAHWNIRQWISLVGVLAAVVVSAYFDEPIRYIFLRIHGPNLDSVFKFAHWFGTGYPTLYFFLGLYAGGLAFNSEKVRLGGLMVLQSYLYSGAITISLKSIVGRWRPAAGHGHLTFSPWTTTPNAHLSFPSGDVAVVFSLAIVMTALSKNLIWKALWIIIAVLTSLSRIYYDAHWFSDVIFSAVNAIAAGVWVAKSYRAEVGELR